MFNNNYNNVSSMFRNPNEVSAPVSEGKTYDVRIEDVAQKGDGIARVEGYVIFVPNTRAGEEVTIKIERTLPKYAFASVVSSETETEVEEEVEENEDGSETHDSPFFVGSDES